MAEYLAQRDWQVTVIAQAPHYPQNRVYAGYGHRATDIRTEHGVEIVRLKPWIVPKDNLLLRLLTEAWFCLWTIPLVLQRKADAAVASSPYMFLGPVGLFLARLKRARFIWDVRDLTWLYPRATGKKTYGLDRPIEQIMLWTASRSDMLTTATEGLLSYFSHKPTQAMVLANGVSDEWLDKLLSLGAPVQSSKPIVTYAGLLGFNHALGTLIEAAKLLPDVEFIIAGEGPERPALEQQVSALILKNVSFVGYLSQEGLLEVYQKSAVLVSHVRSNPLYAWTQPAKLWEYMASGRPIVHAGQGEIIPLLEQNSLAVTVSPEHPEMLAQAIRDLLANSEQGHSMAERARAFVVEHRRRSKLLEQFATLLESLT